MEIGTRVIATKTMLTNNLECFGEGIYIGDLIPDASIFPTFKIKIPCIKLDNGKYIWGFQCWYMSLEKYHKEMKRGISKTTMIDVDDIGQVYPLRSTAKGE